MKNFIQPGDALELTAPTGGVVSGEGYAFGPATSKMVVIASFDAAQTEKATFNSEGVYSVKKDGADDFVEGEIVFWDDSASKKADKTAVGLVPMGTCVETTITSAVLIKVKLFGRNETVVV